MKKKHAVYSPSKMARIIQCPGTIAMCEGLPDRSTIYAAEGTAAHRVAAWTLQDKHGSSVRPHAWVGRIIEVEEEDQTYKIEVTTEMADEVEKYTDAIRAQAEGGEMLVEQDVPIGQITEEEEATGEADAIVIAVDNELIVNDLKFGKGVQVDAENNPQTMMYTLGVMSMLYELFGMTFDSARMVIHQPRRNHVTEHVVSTRELRAFADEKVRPAIALARASKRGENLRAGDDCTFCPARATCPEFERKAFEGIAEDFEALVERPVVAPTIEAQHTDPDRFARIYANLGLLEDYVAAIRDEAARRAHAGDPRFKLVAGKRGNRAWRDPNGVWVHLGSKQLDPDVYAPRELLSPAQLEHRYKKTPVWEELKSFITQPDGKPQVVLASDPRPAVNTADVFDNEELV